METDFLFRKAKPTFVGMKRFWRRRRYQRLDGAITTRKKTKVIRLRGSSRRYLRIKAIPKLRLVVTSPLKLLVKIKKAYVDFMLRLSGNVGALNTNNVFGHKRIPKARQVSTGYSGDAFEARLVYEISKTLIASHELNPVQ